MSGSALTCAKENVTVSKGETDVTGRARRLTIVSVRTRTEQMLTKRRAVDFCRLAASLCRTA